MAEVKKVVLAYSGGLDTSIIIPWLKENYNNPEIIAVSGNVGQADELEGLEAKAIATGIAESLDAIKASGVSTQEANTLFLFTQWTDMMTDFAKTGKASTVVLPSDFNSTASMFEQLLTADAADKGDGISR